MPPAMAALALWNHCLVSNSSKVFEKGPYFIDMIWAGRPKHRDELQVTKDVAVWSGVSVV